MSNILCQDVEIVSKRFEDDDAPDFIHHNLGHSYYDHRQVYYEDVYLYDPEEEEHHLHTRNEDNVKNTHKDDGIEMITDKREIKVSFSENPIMLRSHGRLQIFCSSFTAIISLTSMLLRFYFS